MYDELTKAKEKYLSLDRINMIDDKRIAIAEEINFFRQECRNITV
jgi:hypothetical protein